MDTKIYKYVNILTILQLATNLYANETGSSGSNTEHVNYEIYLFIFGLQIGVMCKPSGIRN